MSDIERLSNKKLAARLRNMDDAMAPNAPELVNEAATRLEQSPWVLTLNDAGLLSDLIRGVQAKAKLRWYQFGTRDADHPLIVTMRAFTYDGGGFIREHDDVLNAYVWCSGIFERWIKVSDIIKALDNLQGKHGLENPMAVIEYKE
jgi:hypothetical protein